MTILEEVGLFLELLELPRPTMLVDYGPVCPFDPIVKLKVPQPFLVGILHGRLTLRTLLADHSYKWDNGVKKVPRWPKK